MDDILDKIQTFGCEFGKIEAQKAKETTRRVKDLEDRWNWIIVISFTTLVGVAFQIGLNFMKLSPNIQHYPLP